LVFSQLVVHRKDIMCDFNFYEESEKTRPRLYCLIDKQLCPYSKMCNKENKFIAINDEQERCVKRMTQLNKNIPSGALSIVTSRKNTEGKLILYISVDKDHTKKIQTNLTEINQNYIYIKKGEVSLTPFVIKNERKSR